MAKGTHCHLCNPLSPASSHRRSAPPHPAGSPWPSARAGRRVPSLCSTFRAKLSRLRLAFHFLSLWVNHVDSDRNQMFPCVVQNCVAHEVPLHVVFTTAATSTVVRRKTSKHCEETANVASRPCVTTRLMTHSGSPIAATEHTVPSSVRPRAGMGGAGGGRQVAVALGQGPVCHSPRLLFEFALCFLHPQSLGMCGMASNWSPSPDCSTIKMYLESNHPWPPPLSSPCSVSQSTCIWNVALAFSLASVLPFFAS